MIETAAIVAVIVGVMEAIKALGLPARFAGITAVVLGVFTAFGFDGVSALSAFTGVSYGLMAAGLYSGTKAVLFK